MLLASLPFFSGPRPAAAAAELLQEEFPDGSVLKQSHEEFPGGPVGDIPGAVGSKLHEGFPGGPEQGELVAARAKPDADGAKLLEGHPDGPELDRLAEVGAKLVLAAPPSAMS